MDEPSNLKKQKHPHTPITLLYVLLICSDEYEKYSFSSVPWNSKPSHIIPCHTIRMTSDKKYAQFLHFYKNRLDMQCNVNNNIRIVGLSRSMWNNFIVIVKLKRENVDILWKNEEFQWNNNVRKNASLIY